MSDGDKALEQKKAGEGDRECWVCLGKSCFEHLIRAVRQGLGFRQRLRGSRMLGSLRSSGKARAPVLGALKWVKQGRIS